MATRISDLGISPHHPIRVGGGNLFGPFNERQYLARLRCRNGQPPEFIRSGSFIPENATTPLDIYTLSGSGLGEPIQLLFDIYTLPSCFEAPSGFALDRPDELLNLPRSLVTGFRLMDTSQPQQQPPRRWRILNAAGSTLGFASWDGLRNVALDLPKNTGALVRERVDHYLSVTPPGQFQPVLEDIFERYIPLESEGLVRGIPDNTQEGRGEQTPPAQAQPKKRKFWLL